MSNERMGDRGSRVSLMVTVGWIAFLVIAFTLLFPRLVQAQRVLSTPDRVVNVARGTSALVTLPVEVSRVSIADPGVADAQVMSPTEVLINGVSVGTTSLFIWDTNNVARLFNVEVTADVAALERQLNELFPGTGLQVSTSLGNSVVLSGEVRDPSVARRSIQIAQAAGLQVIDNITAPSPEQILLHVRFAEVDRNVLRDWGSTIFARNPQNYGDMFGYIDNVDEMNINTVSEGLVTLAIAGADANLDLLIRALKGTGEFNSLAEPNLVALEGQEATFLAGGEFPYPVVQGQNSNAITIQWREFGVRLNFTPTITNNGNIRLNVEPEVSSLDFANGLQYQGFEIPTLLTRRVTSEVELAPGEHLAIGGLMDNTLIESVDKIPVLGDIPILGYFFKSTNARQRRTELLVIVTPHIVHPSTEAPALPTGEVETWDWDRYLRDPNATGTVSGSGGQSSGGGGEGEGS